MAAYEILTYDVELGKYTPQEGVPAYVEGLGDLKRTFRVLQHLGYSCHRSGDDSDPAVLVTRIDDDDNGQVLS